MNHLDSLKLCRPRALILAAKNYAPLMVCALLMLAPPAAATTVIARFGPPATGGGGTNPVSLPPALVDTEISVVTAGKMEFNISVCPGILIGKRFDKDGYYGSGGAGLVITQTGGGIGGYAAIGYETSGTVKFNADFKQAIGLAASGLLSSYALRIGAGYEF